MVEIDPRDPTAKPVKRTALGRIKHETATVTESRGRVVVYTGDDQVGEYIYKFVSAGRWRTMRATGRHPLDHGTLYVARFDDDGTGRWLALAHGTGPLTVANGWRDQADVLLRTRQAADAVGATPMDRPEWIAVHPHTNEVYATLSNGPGFPNAANPRQPNPFGHIVRWRERHGDATATTFEWDIFLLAGDPAFDPSVPLDAAGMFGSPDGLAFDGDGRLWIQSDISNSSLNNPGRTTSIWATTRCWRRTRSPGRYAASRSGRAVARCPGSPSPRTTGPCSSTSSTRVRRWPPWTGPPRRTHGR